MSRVLVAVASVLALSLAVPQGPVLAVGRASAAAPTPQQFFSRLKYYPHHYVPASGPKFNNPYGGAGERRRILHHVIETINSTPGYRLRNANGKRIISPITHRPVVCPSNPRLFPAQIKIALYSIADKAFTDALIRAHRRCVSVKILMNSHLNADTSPSWRRLINALGTRPAPSKYESRRSFAYRCSHGCLGSAVLHTKMYVFSNTYRSQRVVMTGSSNMTSNAVKVQWNDLYTVRNNARLYGDYRGQFMRMVRDRTGGRPRVFREGGYTSTFYPFFGATRSSDLTMRALNSIRCTGARGAGINGHSVVYIAMHSWHGTRGKYLAQRVRQMYSRGCYVRILYSFMGHGTFTLLTRNTGSRMVARRVLFPGPRGLVAAKYSHMKMFAAAGNVAGNPGSHVVWTGSNNWADRSIRCDEVTLRIASASAYRRYVDHWTFMRNRRSSAKWAIYPEPSGGGRAPADAEG
ncbi:MAG: hypothetical protein HOQ45_14550 [Nocardioidaceae bacterium]|nr:hypothetical protein [Nocardioidaceae bacterium]